MANIDSAIQWYENRKGKVTYSMSERRGPNSYDCSSALYYALIQGEFLPANTYIGNTDSLFNDLERNGWVQLQPNSQGNFDTRRGDVFIWGIRGDSNGALGHTGIFVDADNIDHCSYGYNGIATSSYDWLHSINGNAPQTFYRYAGTQVVNNPTDQVVEVGSFIKLDKTYRADDVQNIADVWQVKTNVLCPVGFTWADNGIPAAALVEVDTSNNATPDQVLDIGSLYRIPGKFQVLDVGLNAGHWLAQIEYNGLKFWVDIETATEVSSNDPGTPTPTIVTLPKPTVPQSPVITPVPVVVKPPVENMPVTTPTPTTELPKQPSGNILNDIVSQLESNKTILMNVVVTFVQTFMATWAMTNFAVNKLALSGAIGAGLSAVYNLVIKPAAKALMK